MAGGVSHAHHLRFGHGQLCRADGSRFYRYTVMKKPEDMTAFEVVLEVTMWVIMAFVALLLAAIPKSR